ncbi:hypothetical protein BKA66DRAFT_438635 [Pyrenochaeta sp. MPI-SDFR-AT-0127]|nr:hypothetical protein BKA66DRAFT_438635 [Pyrenochaeta sp. MPI-SDFR-AT-0127]
MDLEQLLAQTVAFGKERPVSILALCFLATAEGKTLRFLTKGLAALALESFQLNSEISFLSIDPRDAAPVQHLVALSVVRRTPEQRPVAGLTTQRDPRERQLLHGFRTCRYRGEGVCRCVGGRHYRVSVRVSGMPKRNKNAWLNQRRASPAFMLARDHGTGVMLWDEVLRKGERGFTTKYRHSPG